MSLGDWPWRNGSRGENLQLAYLLSWPVRLVCSQGVPAGVGGWVDGIREGKFYVI